jgi:cysteine desulfurase
MDEDAAHVSRLWDVALELLPSGWVINGSIKQRYHGNLNIQRDGLDVSRLISDLRDVSFAAASACASGSGRSSHVLRGIGLDEAKAKSSVRLGFGRYTTLPELREGLRLIFAAADRQR